MFRGWCDKRLLPTQDTTLLAIVPDRTKILFAKYLVFNFILSIYYVTQFFPNYITNRLFESTLDLINFTIKYAYLYAMILLVAHIDESQGVGGDAPRIIEPAVGGALRTEGPQKTAGRIEHLDPVIVTVRNDVLPDPVYGHSGETVKLALAAAVCTELLHEVPITIEYLRTEREQRCKVVYIDRRDDIKIGLRPIAITTGTRGIFRRPRNEAGLFTIVDTATPMKSSRLHTSRFMCT